jgi:hypothetical protein
MQRTKLIPNRWGGFYGCATCNGELVSKRVFISEQIGYMETRDCPACGWQQGLYKDEWKDEILSHNEREIIKRLTAAMQEADQQFEAEGGGTRHYVRECLLPILEQHGLRIVLI